MCTRAVPGRGRPGLAGKPRPGRRPVEPTGAGRPEASRHPGEGWVPERRRRSARLGRRPEGAPRAAQRTAGPALRAADVASPAPEPPGLPAGPGPVRPDSCRSGQHQAHRPGRRPWWAAASTCSRADSRPRPHRPAWDGAGPPGHAETRHAGSAPARRSPERLPPALPAPEPPAPGWLLCAPAGRAVRVLGAALRASAPAHRDVRLLPALRPPAPQPRDPAARGGTAGARARVPAWPGAPGWVQGQAQAWLQGQVRAWLQGQALARRSGQRDAGSGTPRPPGSRRHPPRPPRRRQRAPASRGATTAGTPARQSPARRHPRPSTRPAARRRDVAAPLRGCGVAHPTRFWSAQTS